MADVLIVEDVDVQMMLLRGFLDDHHEVIGTASTSAEAVRVAITSSPDVVIMDLNLADGTGIEATNEIKSADPAIPIIISTVDVTEDVKHQTLQAGADAYLVKPYSKQKLLETIENVLL